MFSTVNDLIYKPAASVGRAVRMRIHPRPYDRCLHQMEEAQWSSPEEVRELQWSKLQRLLIHAVAHVPYYRKLFADGGLKIGEFAGPEDLIRLPVLTREMVRSRADELKSEVLVTGETTINHTGGSTGQPLTFLQDTNFKIHCAANLRRCAHMCGYSFPQRTAILWGADPGVEGHRDRRAPARDLILQNTVSFNSFGMTAQEWRGTVRTLARFRPEFIVAYVSSATTLARFAVKADIHSIRPSAIQTSAELLTEPERTLIGETFGCGVFDRYGCREVGNIAHECSSHAGLHVLSDTHVVELLNNGQPVTPSQQGLITVTNLDNFAMPLIRYQVGDVGTPVETPCPCGRGLPLMKVDIGRSTDIVTSPGGKFLHGEFFSHLMYGRFNIERFQVVQTSQHHLHVRVVPDDGFSAADEKDLKAAIQRHGDPDFCVEIEVCDEIAPGPSGKHRFVISTVPVDYG